jgi:hypothetical protein
MGEWRRPSAVLWRSSDSKCALFPDLFPWSFHQSRVLCAQSDPDLNLFLQGVGCVCLALPQDEQESNVLNFTSGAAGLLTTPAK